jgi:hypothetical protein
MLVQEGEQVAQAVSARQGLKQRRLRELALGHAD